MKLCCVFFRLFLPPRCFFFLGSGALLPDGSSRAGCGAVLEVGLAIDSGPATLERSCRESAIVGEEDACVRAIAESSNDAGDETDTCRTA